MRKLCAIIGLGLLLSGCSSTRGPSNPAKELCSGTKRPYKINGIQYVPQDHYDYDEKGVASWYGPGFHKRSTSCGSIYDMHAYTAAHKTLPIPSVVEVTNLENKKSLRLVINDRGPFVDDRIIDLSKKAAQELGSHGKGLVRVRVRAIPEDSVALANYLKRFGRYGIDPQGRSWDTIYKEEIASRGYNLDPLPRNEPEEPEDAVYRTDAAQQPKIQTAVANVEKERPLPKAKTAVYTQADKEAFTNLLHQAATSESSAGATSAGTGQHYIHVGSFIQKQNAMKLKDELSKHGQSNITEAKKQGQRFFSVRLGPFKSPSQAQKVIASMENDGYYGVRSSIN